MIWLADTVVTINRPVNIVFDYVSDLCHFGDWFPAVREIKSGNDKSKIQSGKIYWETVAIGFGRQRCIELKVIDVQLNQHFVTEGQLPSLLPRMEIHFHGSENPTATTVRWCMYSRRTRGLARYLVIPLARRVMSRRAHIGLRNLKHLLEKPST